MCLLTFSYVLQHRKSRLSFYTFVSSHSMRWIHFPARTIFVSTIGIQRNVSETGFLTNEEIVRFFRLFLFLSLCVVAFLSLCVFVFVEQGRFRFLRLGSIGFDVHAGVTYRS